MGTVGYLALAVAAAALAVAIIASTRRAPPVDRDDPDAAFEAIVAGLRAGRLALDPRIPDNAPPEHKADI
jgi:hypothetical protein